MLFSAVFFNEIVDRGGKKRGGEAEEVLRTTRKQYIVEHTLGWLH